MSFNQLEIRKRLINLKYNLIMILVVIIFLLAYIMSHTLIKRWIDDSCWFRGDNCAFSLIVTILFITIINIVHFVVRYDEKRLYDGYVIERVDEITIEDKYLDTEDNMFNLKNFKVSYVQTDTVDGLKADIYKLKSRDFSQLFIFDGTFNKTDSIVIYNYTKPEL